MHQQYELEDSGGDLTTLAATSRSERRYHQAQDALSQSRYAAANRLDAMIMAELPPLSGTGRVQNINYAPCPNNNINVMVVMLSV